MNEIRMAYPLTDFVPFAGITRHLERKAAFWNRYGKDIRSGAVAYDAYKEALRERTFEIYHGATNAILTVGAGVGIMQALW